MQSGQPQTRQRLLYIFIFFISYTWLQAFELGALKYQATRARMRSEGITGEMWSVRMSTERLLTSLHVHSLMDIVQHAWLFPVFLPLSSPGCTLLPITAHACHPNPCEAECEVSTRLARPIKEDLYSILFSNEIKQRTKHKMMHIDSEDRERLLQPNLLT